MGAFSAACVIRWPPDARPARQRILPVRRDHGECAPGPPHPGFDPAAVGDAHCPRRRGLHHGDRQRQGDSGENSVYEEDAGVGDDL